MKKSFLSTVFSFLEKYSFDPAAEKLDQGSAAKGVDHRAEAEDRPQAVSGQDTEGGKSIHAKAAHAVGRHALLRFGRLSNLIIKEKPEFAGSTNNSGFSLLEAMGLEPMTSRV